MLRFDACNSSLLYRIHESGKLQVILESPQSRPHWYPSPRPASQRASVPLSVCSWLADTALFDHAHRDRPAVQPVSVTARPAGQRSSYRHRHHRQPCEINNSIDVWNNLQPNPPPVADWSTITSSVRWVPTFPTKTWLPAHHIREDHVSHLHIHRPVGIFAHCSNVHLRLT